MFFAIYPQPYKAIFIYQATIMLLNQARAWFLETVFVQEVGMHVCLHIRPTGY